MWALLIITCVDWNNCIMNKTYFQSQGECIAEQNFVRPRLKDIKLVPYFDCFPQETYEGESK